MSESAAHLAANVRQLRRARGLSQTRIAELAGVPRATWTHLESGEANPTLAVLVKVAEALHVRLEELLGPPRSGARLHKSADLPVRSKGSVTVRRLLPDPLAGLEIERLVLPPGGAMAGVPHTAGTHEYLTCERGRVELRVAGEVFTLDAGDVLQFAGDQKHGYRNPGAVEAIAYSVIAFAAPG